MAEDIAVTPIGARLRAEREKQFRSRPELGAKSGVPVPTIEGIERGRVTRPRRTTIDKLAKALGVEAETLMYGAEAADGLAASPRPDRGRVLLGRILDNTSLLKRYMEHPPDEDTWDRALNEHLVTAGDGMACAIRELEQAQAERRPFDRELVIALLQAEKARMEIRESLVEFNSAQYGHRHRDAG